MACLALVVPPAVLGAGLLVDAAGLQAGFAVFAGGNALLAVTVLARGFRRWL
jgi:hypothetical protein